MFKRAASVATIVLTFCAAPATQAQQLNLTPDVAGALNELFNAAVMQCNMGNRQGCDYANLLNATAYDLSGALQACQMNDPQACSYYQNGALQVGSIYQQYAAASMGGGMASGGNMAPGGYSNFDTNAMTMQHNNTMNNMQNQFDQHNSNWAAQQNQIDQAHQNFMSTIN